MTEERPSLFPGQTAEWVVLSNVSKEEVELGFMIRAERGVEEVMEILARYHELMGWICSAPRCEKVLGRGDKALVVEWEERRGEKKGKIRRIYCSVVCQRRDAAEAEWLPRTRH